MTDAKGNGEHHVSRTPLATSHAEDSRVVQERLDLAQERVDIATAFGEKLHTLRRAKRMSQRALAKKCRLSPETVANTEGGRTEPLLYTILNLCDGLDCSPDELIGDLPVPQAPKER